MNTDKLKSELDTALSRFSSAGIAACNSLRDSEHLKNVVNGLYKDVGDCLKSFENAIIEHEKRD